jgi:hypothetical protein
MMTNQAFTGIEYLRDSILTVLNNIEKLPDEVLDEMYFRIYAEVQERNLGEYVEYEEVTVGTEGS